MKMCPFLSRGNTKTYGFERIDCNAPDCMAWVVGPTDHQLSQGYCKLVGILPVKQPIEKEGIEYLLDSLEEWINHIDELTLYKWEVREQIREQREKLKE